MPPPSPRPRLPLPLRSWLVAALLLCACGGAPKRQSRAPDLRLTSLSGAPLALRAQAGRVVVLDFMSSWCQTCGDSLPGMERLAKRYAARGVTIWLVSLDEDRADLEGLLERKGVALPVAMDRGERWFKHFGLSAVPTAVILGRDGRPLAIVNEPPGKATYDEAVRAKLDALLATRAAAR